MINDRKELLINGKQSTRCPRPSFSLFYHFVYFIIYTSKHQNIQASIHSSINKFNLAVNTSFFLAFFHSVILEYIPDSQIKF